nr:reverse transcriptase domain-containing protein [Tanacetum cinerariifolium]
MTSPASIRPFSHSHAGVWSWGHSQGETDAWSDLREKFVERFALRRRCSKDPTEVSKIVRKANESLSDFKERWTEEIGYIQGVPEVMQILAFMSNSKCPELARRFANQTTRGKPTHGEITNMVHEVGKNRKRKCRGIWEEDWMSAPITFPSIPSDDVSDEPLIVKAEIGGFLGEQLRPVGKIKLEVVFGNEGLSRRTMMKFTVVEASSPYNIIFGRTGMRELRAVSSTTHAMMKFPTPRGIAMLVPRMDAIFKCRQIEVRQASPEEPATYQRLVDSAFQTQLGRNLEAYVDDMVIKSQTKKDMIMDMMEMFDNLKNINMKMNPKKCSFGVKEGKFRRYMVTSEGIRAIPKKKKEVADMQSPKKLMEMQSLSGKLAALNYFLSRSTERAMPFFNTLKNITKENKDDFCWTEAAEQAFQELEIVIMELPTLTTPNLKETLYVYLAASREAVNEVLKAGRKGKQTPIRYVSRTLHEAEKIHPVRKVSTMSITPISETAALAKYAVDLGAYNIAYMLRNTIKGQVLADFLNEVSVGTGNVEGAGAGLVLIDPTGTEYTYAIRLNFASTNDEAEYEALLAGLQIAGKMKVPSLKVKVDSKLVACQMNEGFVASNDGMAKYLMKAKELSAGFEEFSIENVPRNQNQKADVVSKLASVAFNHLTKEILVEVLNAKSVEVQEVKAIVEEEGNNWMTPIIKCIDEGLAERQERSKDPTNEDRPIRDGRGNLIQKVLSISDAKMRSLIASKLHNQGNPRGSMRNARRGTIDGGKNNEAGILLAVHAPGY